MEHDMTLISQNSSTELSFRYAEKKDCGLILHFIKELASYEKMLDEIVATEELLQEWIFEKQKAEVIFACLWVQNLWRIGRCIG